MPPSGCVASIAGVSARVVRDTLRRMSDLKRGHLVEALSRLDADRDPVQLAERGRLVPEEAVRQSSAKGAVPAPRPSSVGGAVADGAIDEL